MTKKLFCFVLLLFVLSCSKDSNQNENPDPQPDAEETMNEEPQEEQPPSISNIDDKDLITIDIEIPESLSFTELKVKDDIGNSSNLNSTLKVNVVKNTIVSLVRQDNSVIYVGYFIGQIEGSGKGTSKNLNSCSTRNSLGSRSTVEFILANIAGPAGNMAYGISNRSELYDIYRSNILCELFSEDEITQVETAIGEAVGSGQSILEDAATFTIQNAVKPITGGLFADCWEILVESVSRGEIQYDEHPQAELNESLEFFSSDTPGVPYSETVFNSALPNGIILKSAKPVNGKWKIEFKAYNSLPIPVGIRLGKRKEGTQNVGEPSNNQLNFILGSNGNSFVQIFRNGISCQGAANNFLDSYYTVQSEGVALRSNEFNNVEIELDFDPLNQFIIFQGPSENIDIKIYHILESMSTLIDLALGFHKTGEKENSSNFEILSTKQKVILELISVVREDAVVLNLLNTSSNNLNELQQAVGKITQKYVIKVIEEGLESSFKDYWLQQGFTNSQVEESLLFYEWSLDFFDSLEYSTGWIKSQELSNSLVDFKLFIPEDNIGNGNVFVGSIQLTSQQEVDDFGASNYAEVTGLLSIGVSPNQGSISDIIDLTPLSSLNKVQTLSIQYNPNLVSLDGLNNIRSVNSENQSQSNQSNFWITNNDSLKNLNGLESLETVGWALRIEDNLSLESLDGLNSLASIGNNFEITGNNVLEDYCDLQTFLAQTNLIPFIAENQFNPSKQDILDGNCESSDSENGEVSLSDFTFAGTRLNTSDVIRNYSFSKDGSHLYVVRDNQIQHYILPSPYNLSNLNSPDETLVLSSSQGGSSVAKDVVVSTDGTIMYVQADQNGNFNPDYFQQYTLSTPFSLNGTSYVNRIELNTKYNKMELSEDDSKLYIAYHDFFSTIFREIREFQFATANDITTISVINSTPQIYDNGQSAGISYDILDDLSAIYVTDDATNGQTKKFTITVPGDISSIDSENPNSSGNFGEGERIIKVVGDEERLFTLVNSEGTFKINEYARN
jgi:hypothetical protein